MATLAGMLWMLVTPVHAQPVCVAPTLDDARVKAIIDTERAARTDLPAAFAHSRWSVRREGCHYVYIEFSLPETPDKMNIFKLNQNGVIVDAMNGIDSLMPPLVPEGAQVAGHMKCPAHVLTEAELAAIIANERQTRSDLPAAFPSSRVRVERMRCLYLYFEYALPERRGDFQVFTIDPMGELMEFSRSDPY